MVELRRLGHKQHGLPVVERRPPVVPKLVEQHDDDILAVDVDGSLTVVEYKTHAVGPKEPGAAPH